MSCYVFRINYGDYYQMLISEIFVSHRLRQGWGCEGMDIRQPFESFLDGWTRAWGTYETVDEKRVRSKYRNLLIMREMQPGDIIVIPKVSENGDSWRSFTLVQCADSVYDFSPLTSDFGHIINVLPILSCSYDHDDASRTISAKFKAYQSAINRVYDSNFIIAVEQLIEESKKNPTSIQREDRTSLSALLAPTSNARTEYLRKIIERINLWNPTQLERIITELFEKNGFVKIANNRYDREGGDIDIVFSSFVPNTLMSDVFLLSSNSVDIPQIRVQAKKKKGIDSGDKKGVEQLLQMQGEEQTINIVINTTEEFSDIAKEVAGKNVVLINGLQFAALLVKYGLDVIDSFS